MIIGTERMESRRVDNQARGRSGRQGDEGKSIFYVSLEDDLMRIFGSDSMNSILEKLGLKDGESIDHPWINKALERAQQKVESRNFDIRKTLLKFDNVLNDQRQVIFNQRNHIINKNIENKFIDDFLQDVIFELLQVKKTNLPNANDDKFLTKFNLFFGKVLPVEKVEELKKATDENFSSVINNLFKQKRLAREKIIGKEQSIKLEERIFLQIIDQNWKNHIQYLEQLRQVIGLRSYGNRDPLIEYKKEAFQLFENLLQKLKTDIIKILINITVEKSDGSFYENQNLQKNKYNQALLKKKIGRNEKCYCGSGKKFKHCCGSL